MAEKWALLGEKLGHSWSPLIHRKILEATGQTGEYVKLEIQPQELAQTVVSLREKGFEGINVTIPYKQRILPLIDALAPEAAAIGAVNTVHFLNHQSVGHNTDCDGFLMMLRAEKIAPEEKRAVVLGAGGAANAVIAALQKAGAASVRVIARDPVKLAQLQEQFPFVETGLFSEPEKICGNLIVNTTPVGMFPHQDESPVSRELLARFGAAADCVYNPLPTCFVKTAAALGLQACGGLYMLIFQAIRAQEIWQQQTIDPAIAGPIYHELQQQFLTQV